MVDVNPVEEDTKACPVCGESIKKVAIKCRFCNTNLQVFQKNQEAEVEQMLYSGHPAAIYSVWQWFFVVLTLGVAYFFYWLKSYSLTYYLTSQRIKVERGIFSLVKESIELFTIEHFDLHRPLGMRLAGYCLLQLQSTDRNYPTIMLYGIPHLENLAETLRECSLRERIRRRVTSIIQP